MASGYQNLLSISVAGTAFLAVSLGMTRYAEAAILGDVSAVDSSNLQKNIGVAPASDLSVEGDSSASTSISSISQPTSLSFDSQDAKDSNTTTTQRLVSADLTTDLVASSSTSQPVPEPLTVVGTLLGAAGVWRMKQKLAASGHAEVKR